MLLWLLTIFQLLCIQYFLQQRLLVILLEYRSKDLGRKPALLYTASYYDPQDWRGSCFRISRGHPRGRQVQWGKLPFFYPELDLLRAYRSNELDFTAYTLRYLGHLEEEYLSGGELRRWIDEDLTKLDDFTFLCFERQETPCHRRLLARWLLGKCPNLEAGGLR